MKNGKSNTAGSKPSSNGTMGASEMEIPVDAYKTFDIKKAVEQDVRAAVSLLSLILDNPQILGLVVNEIEKIRAKIIEQEGLPKKEDFHPEMEKA